MSMEIMSVCSLSGLTYGSRSTIWSEVNVRLLREEIKYITQHAALSLVYFGILASGASDCSKFFGLNIENFTQEISSGS